MEMKPRTADNGAFREQSARDDGRGYSWSRRWEVGIEPLNIWRFGSAWHAKITSKLPHAADTGTESRRVGIDLKPYADIGSLFR
jgi:hypothetical protein